MRFSVEPGAGAAWDVLLDGVDVPVSRHPTEEAARTAVTSYQARLKSTVGEPVGLRDGRQALIRRIRAEDKPLFVQAWTRFGDASRHSRFLGFKHELSLRDLAYLTELDHVDHEALVALDVQMAEGQIGVARYVRDPNRPDVAEIAVAIDDRWQGCGLGTALLERLSSRAVDVGIEGFSALLFASNTAMLRVLRRIGQTTVTRREQGTLELQVRLGRTRPGPSPTGRRSRLT
jgi:GNAT superfamily N-acetyltransferase